MQCCVPEIEKIVSFTWKKKIIVVSIWNIERETWLLEAQSALMLGVVWSTWVFGKAMVVREQELDGKEPSLWEE